MKHVSLILTLSILSSSVFADAISEANSYSGAYSGSQGYNAQGQTLHYAPQSHVEATDFAERAPTIFVPGNASGTNPCLVSVSGGVSVGGQSGLPGFGISGGKAYTDEECEIRESLRMAAALTPKDNATEAQELFLKNIACQSKVFSKAMELTAAELNDSRFGCASTLPPSEEPIAMRPMVDRGAEVVVVDTVNEEGVIRPEQYAREDDSGWDLPL